MDFFFLLFIYIKLFLHCMVRFSRGTPNSDILLLPNRAKILNLVVKNCCKRLKVNLATERAMSLTSDLHIDHCDVEKYLATEVSKEM